MSSRFLYLIQPTVNLYRWRLVMFGWFNVRPVAQVLSIDAEDRSSGSPCELLLVCCAGSQGDGAIASRAGLMDFVV